MYSLFQKALECHIRIIWGCSITDDNEYFVTGSRDGFTKIWKKNGENHEEPNKYSLNCELEHEDPITSVELLTNKEKTIILLTGSETGNLSIFKLETNTETKMPNLRLIYRLPKNWSFGEKVHRIRSYTQEDRVNKLDKEFEESKILVACCGDDHSVRIFSISKNIFNN